MNLVAAVAAILMTALVFSSAVMRYLLGAPMRFSDELTGLLFVTMAFLALPLGLLRRQHITVDLAISQLRPAGQRLAELVAALIMIVFAVVFIVASWGFVGFSQLIDARSEIAGLLLWPWMALMPICVGIMLIVTLCQMYDTIRWMRGLEPLIALPSEQKVNVE